MTADELRELANALEPMACAPRFDGLDVPALTAYLRACADALEAGPVTRDEAYDALQSYRHLSDHALGSAEQQRLDAALLERLRGKSELRLPEPMTTDELIAAYEFGPPSGNRHEHGLRAIEAETLRRVKEVNE